MSEPNPLREEAFSEWWTNVILPGDTREDVAHETFCSGWEALSAVLGSDHYVIFTEDRWTIEHSVECRLSGQMHACVWHEAVRRIAGEFDPDMAGRWRIAGIDSEGLPSLERAEATP